MAKFRHSVTGNVIEAVLFEFGMEDGICGLNARGEGEFMPKDDSELYQQVQHVWWRNVPVNDGEGGMIVYETSTPGRGAYPVTVLYHIDCRREDNLIRPARRPLSHIVPDPPKFPPFPSAFCEECGSRSDTLNSTWRWNGEQWEHRCAGLYPGIGHWVVPSVDVEGNPTP
jgi:hypothetical protein